MRSTSKKLSQLYRTGNIPLCKQAELLHEWLGFAERGYGHKVFRWSWDVRAERYVVFPFMSDLYRVFQTDNYQQLISRMEGAFWKASFANFSYPLLLKTRRKAHDHYYHTEAERRLLYYESRVKPIRKSIRYFAVPSDLGRKLIRSDFKADKEFIQEFPGPWLRRFIEKMPDKEAICLNLIQAVCVVTMHPGIVRHGMRTSVLLPSDIFAGDIDATMWMGRNHASYLHTDYYLQKVMSVEALPILSYFRYWEDFKEI